MPCVHLCLPLAVDVCEMFAWRLSPDACQLPRECQGEREKPTQGSGPSMEVLGPIRWSLLRFRRTFRHGNTGTNEYGGLVDEINRSFRETLLNFTVMQARCPM